MNVTGEQLYAKWAQFMTRQNHACALWSELEVPERHAWNMLAGWIEEQGA